MSWADQAACIGHPPAMFFPWPTGCDLDRGHDQTIGDAAIAICRQCPVQQRCLDEAVQLEQRNPQGIRGGATPRQRRRLAYAASRSPVDCPDCGTTYGSTSALGRHRVRDHGIRAACGTPAGYGRHMRDREPSCDDCRAAQTDDQRRRRAARRGAA